jgi:TRAP-type C4-dicarboxylate transport system substrate-binding protein
MKKTYSLISLSLAVVIYMIFLIPNFSPPAYSAEVNLKIANYFPPPAMQTKLLGEFAKELEARSGGRIKTQYFPGGSLLQAPATAVVLPTLAWPILSIPGAAFPSWKPVKCRSGMLPVG